MERFNEIENKIERAQGELINAITAVLPICTKVLVDTGQAKGQKARQMVGTIISFSDQYGYLKVKSNGGIVKKKHYTGIWYNDIPIE